MNSQRVDSIIVSELEDVKPQNIPKINQKTISKMYKTFSTFSIYVFAMTIKFHKLSDITDPYVTNMLYNIFCIHLNIFKK